MTRLFPSGDWQISAIVGNRLLSRRFSGYTKREALALYRAEVRTMNP
jgi:hypothetical protein